MTTPLSVGWIKTTPKEINNSIALKGASNIPIFALSKINEATVPTRKTPNSTQRIMFIYVSNLLYFNTNRIISALINNIAIRIVYFIINEFKFFLYSDLYL